MSDVTTQSATRAEYCAVACAEIFAGAGEIFASRGSWIPAFRLDVIGILWNDGLPDITHVRAAQ